MHLEHVICLMALFLSACGNKGETGCTPNDTQPCLCSGGESGVQVCNEDGTAWSPCDCGGTDASTDSDADPDPDPDEACLSDPDCSNGLACDGEETCVDGTCIDGDPPDCDDGDDCTTDSCDEDAGGCVHEDPDVDGDGYVDEACGGDDCDDARDDVYPGSTELGCLDGADQDCDGETDELVPIDAHLRVTNNLDRSVEPSMTWTGSEFGVGWMDDRRGNFEIYFTMISADGSEIADDRQISNGGAYASSPSVTWTGSEFGMSWRDDRDADGEIYFIRIDSTGSRIGTGTRITDAAGGSMAPCLAWSGSEFGLGWQDDRGGMQDIYFTRISNSGTKIGSDVNVTASTSRSSSPSLVWTGSEFGLAWADPSSGPMGIYFARISESGAVVGSGVRISDDGAGANKPSLAWSGSEFAVAWQDSRDGYQIFLARVSASGIKLGSDTRISYETGTSDQPGLTWTGSEYAAVWQGFISPNNLLFLATVSADGGSVSQAVQITGPSNSSGPSMVWTGSELGVSRMDTLGGPDDIYFIRIGFCG